MKNIKSLIFILFIIFSSTVIITSCSKEDDNNSLNENVKVSNYLKSFYSTNFKLGKSVETNLTKETSTLSRSTELENLVITEVFVGDNPIARGYVITDKLSNAFLYFIDVDRVDFKLTSVKIDVNETKVFEDINQLDKYIITNQLDYIKIAEDYQAGIGTIEANRFWGWQQWVDCDEATGQGTLMETYYVFGIGVKTRKVRGLAGEDVIQPCGGGALLDD